MLDSFSCIDDLNAAKILGGTAFKGPITLVQAADQMNIAKPRVYVNPTSSGMGRRPTGIPGLNIANLGDIYLANGADFKASIFSL